MNEYVKIPLSRLIDNIGEEKAIAILSDFSCPVNPDIEIFLRTTAIEFEKQGLSATHLVFLSQESQNILIGYYTLTTKAFNITEAAISKNLSKRISKFATYDNELDSYFLPAPLLAQLGKNFNNEYNRLITGDELLKMAVDDVKLIQRIVGGKILYLECENKSKLLEFYESNGFVRFADRKLDRDESNIDSTYLVQMLRYLK